MRFVSAIRSSSNGPDSLRKKHEQDADDAAVLEQRRQRARPDARDEQRRAPRRRARIARHVVDEAGFARSEHGFGDALALGNVGIGADPRLLVEGPEGAGAGDARKPRGGGIVEKHRRAQDSAGPGQRFADHLQHLARVAGVDDGLIDRDQQGKSPVQAVTGGHRAPALPIVLEIIERARNLLPDMFE